jgi:hypothetical protein
MHIFPFVNFERIEASTYLGSLMAGDKNVLEEITMTNHVIVANRSYFELKSLSLSLFLSPLTHTRAPAHTRPRTHVPPHTRAPAHMRPRTHVHPTHTHMHTHPCTHAHSVIHKF